MRGTFDPGYLCYTLGKLELLSCGATCARSGAMPSPSSSSMMTCSHFGAPPLALVRAAMLREDDGHVL